MHVFPSFKGIERISTTLRKNQKVSGCSETAEENRLDSNYKLSRLG